MKGDVPLFAIVDDEPDRRVGVTLKHHQSIGHELQGDLGLNFAFLIQGRSRLEIPNLKYFRGQSSNAIGTAA